MKTKAVKAEFETISFIFIAAIISAILVFGRNHFQFNFGGITVTPSAFIQDTPTPTPIPKTATVSQISSDGKKKLLMKVLTNKDYTQDYTFFASDYDGTNQKFIFKTTVEATESMGIPFNTWSPDDRYFFITKHTPTSNIALVFNEGGEPFSETESFFNATDLFNARETGYEFDEATGWASETLVLINTKTQEGKKGPSFWFEVPSKAIIQLSTEF